MTSVKSLTFLLAILSPSLVSAKQLTLNEISPVVVASSPISGNANVNASTTEISVTFSKDMKTDKMWSLVKVNGAQFPKITSDVYFKKDARTFVIPVKLEANTLYAFSINSNKHFGFKSKTGKPAQPYIVSFETGN